MKVGRIRISPWFPRALALTASVLACAAATALPAAAAPTTRLRPIAFAEHGGVRLAYDVVRPAGPAGAARRRAVVLVHGGGWWSGGRSDLVDKRPVAEWFAQAGFVAIVPDYRLACGTSDEPRSRFGFDFTTGDPLCGARMRDQVADVLDAVRHVRAHAGRLGVDPQRIGLLGVSAGGHLALLAAEEGRGSARVDAVVNVSGPTSTGFVRLQDPRPAPPARSIRASFTNAVGCLPSACPRAWTVADPTARLHLLRPSTAVLLVASPRETQAPLATMRTFAARARGAGRRVQVLPGLGACHGTGCIAGVPAGTANEVGKTGVASSPRRAVAAFLHASLR